MGIKPREIAAAWLFCLAISALAFGWRGLHGKTACPGPAVDPAIRHVAAHPVPGGGPAPLINLRRRSAAGATTQMLTAILATAEQSPRRWRA